MRQKESHAIKGGYDPTFFETLVAAEDRHFWFRARNEIILRIVRQIAPMLPPGYRVLDAGCGTGNVLRVLEKVCAPGSVTGMDLFPEGLHYARQRTSCEVIQGDIHNPPFKTPFNLIGLFDVLEHLPDDPKVLRDLHAMLAPQGFLLLTVPAHQSLWSYFDDAAHHCRRYEVSELEDKLRKTGFEIVYVTEFMRILFPLVWIGRKTAALRNRLFRFRPQSAHDLTKAELKITPGLNEILTFFLMKEVRLVEQRKQLRRGTSVLAIARKK